MDNEIKNIRHKVMSKIKSKDTQPELFLRRELWHAGIRYRKNYPYISGTPDIYIPKYKTAIFVNGCFWHQHEAINCPLSHMPKSNLEFWKNKFRRNINRDQENKVELISSSIQVIVVWECTLKKMMKDSNQKSEILSKIIYSIKSGEYLYYEF